MLCFSGTPQILESHVILTETKDHSAPWGFSSWTQILRRGLRMATRLGSTAGTNDLSTFGVVISNFSHLNPAGERFDGISRKHGWSAEGEGESA